MRALHRRFAALAFLAALLAVAIAPAEAGPFDDALAGFTADSFSDTGDAINAVAASGNPLAARVLEALQDARLLFSAEAKKVFIKDKAGKLYDAATGTALAGAPPADLDNVRLNNRLRGALDAAIGSLTLMAADPARRIEAAQAVFKSRQESALPALEKALERETDATIKDVMMQARASIVLGMTDAKEADQIAAIATLRERGDQEALAMLRGLPADAPAAVKAAADAAIGAIQEHLALWNMVQNAWYGLSLGSVLLLAAIGLAITFGVMGVINMAHGEMVMLGAYTTFMVQEVIRANNPALFDYSLTIALPLAFIVAGAVGMLIERTVIRFLYGRPLETLLATWGLSLILQQAVRTVFGPTNREVGAPTWMSGAFQLGQMTITYNRLWIIVFTAAVFVALLALLR